MSLSNIHNARSTTVLGKELVDRIDAAGDELAAITQTLVRIPSESPVSDTCLTVKKIIELLDDQQDIATDVYVNQPPIENLVAKVCSGKPGKRLILNGHLDTYPAGDRNAWHLDPFSGTIEGDRIYGRGAADMKGGVACQIYAFNTLARMRDCWSGEICLVLAGDEETMGIKGSKYLIDNVEDAVGDAVLIADVGSPLVPRIGEKGMIWIDIFSKGRPAHGAHVHRGKNAIDLLRRAMDSLAKLSSYPINAPDEVTRTIQSAQSTSEPLGGSGEAKVLQELTVNFGRIQGGETANLVPDWAEVNADIRLPMGVSVSDIKDEIHRILDPIDDIEFKITREYEPSWTSPDDPIVAATLDACSALLDREPRVNMRVGASDARLYRAAGIPTVVCGLSPNNLGGPNEYAEISELKTITKIIVLTALKYLSPNS